MNHFLPEFPFLTDPTSRALSSMAGTMVLSTESQELYVANQNVWKLKNEVMGSKMQKKTAEIKSKV